VSFDTPPVPENGKPDPFLEEILHQPVVGKVANSDTLKADVVLREVPPQTPLADARAIMERHGFACWSGVPDNNRTCLYCTAWKPRGADRADHVVVKLFYENRRVLLAEVLVEHDLRHASHDIRPAQRS
jgi:hypothetical protein